MEMAEAKAAIASLTSGGAQGREERDREEREKEEEREEEEEREKEEDALPTLPGTILPESISVSELLLVLSRIAREENGARNRGISLLPR